MTVRPWLALQVTLVVQVLATFVLVIAPVLAPAVAPQIGLSPRQVGMFSGTIYLFAMLSGLFLGPWINVFGAVRSTQLVLVLQAAGALLATLGGAAALMAAAALIGVGYGAANPAAAAILGRHAPSNSAGLFFAVKQAGVPAGVALGGLLLPVGLVFMGWRGTVWSAVAICLLAAAALMPVVHRLEDKRSALRSRVNWVGSLASVFRHVALRRLSLMSTAYAMAQQAFLTYSVSLLVQSGVQLAVAAGLLAASQLLSVPVRIGMGYLADRWVAPRLLLGTLGLAIAAGSVALALLPANPGPALASVIVIFAGAANMGWNGVFYAQLIRVVPREELAQSTGGTQVFMFGGSMLGPFLFAQLLALGVSYTMGYAGFALLAAMAAISMLLSSEPRTGREVLDEGVQRPGDPRGG